MNEAIEDMDKKIEFQDNKKHFFSWKKFQLNRLQKEWRKQTYLKYF